VCMVGTYVGSSDEFDVTCLFGHVKAKGELPLSSPLISVSQPNSLHTCKLHQFSNKAASRPSKAWSLVVGRQLFLGLPPNVRGKVSFRISFL